METHTVVLDKENRSSLGLNQDEVKFSVKRNINYTGASRKISDLWWPNCFPKTGTVSVMAAENENFYTYFTKCSENELTLRQRRIGPCSPIPLLIIWKARMKSAWREKDLSRQSLSHVWHVSLYLYMYLRRYSPGAVWAGITNWVDHASDGGTLGTTVLCELTRDFHPVLSPSCVAEDSRSGERFQACIDRGCPRLQLTTSSPVPRARRCEQM